jgi:hypothetical protein
VEDVSFTVTFTPADVDRVKPFDETALTVPVEPPSSLADRAFDPLPAPGPPLGGALGVVVAADDVVDDAGVEVDAQPASTSVAAIAAAATIVHRRPLRTRDRPTQE